MQGSSEDLMNSLRSHSLLRPLQSRLLVVSACSSSKRFSPADQLTEADLDDLERRQRGEARLAHYRLPAAEMYTGNGHRFVREAVEALREAGCVVSHFILSAGYGLLNETDFIVPYNVTFCRAPKNWIRDRGQRLKLRESLTKRAKECDQLILILGREYIEAIGLPLPVEFLPPTIVYVAPSMLGRICKDARVIVVGENERRKMRAYSTSAKERRFKLDVFATLGIKGEHHMHFGQPTTRSIYSC